MALRSAHQRNAVPGLVYRSSGTSGKLYSGRNESGHVGVVNSKRQNKNSQQGSFSKNAPKVLAYETLATLNRDFEQVLGDLERLEELRLFPHRWQRRFLKTWRATLEETRAWANFEVVEILHEREEREWVGFGRIRQRSEKPTGAPTDMLVPTKPSGRKSRGRR